jgi:IPT/TIG domain
MKKRYLVLAIAGVALLMSFPRSTARAEFGFPVVFNTTVDTNANTLTITGINFGENPRVTLGGTQQLTVQNSNSTQIVANLPANLAPGSYLLFLKFGDPTFGVFEVTIGAVGPVGPPGPSGSGGGGDHLFQAQVIGPETLSQAFNAAAITSVLVPAGSYLILGKTSLQNGDVNSVSASCVLEPVVGGFAFFDQASTSVAAGQSGVLSLQSVETFSQPTTINLQCIQTAGTASSVSASNTVLSALSVGAIN